MSRVIKQSSCKMLPKNRNDIIHTVALFKNFIPYSLKS